MKFSVTTLAPDVLFPFQFSLLEGNFSERLQKTARLGFDGVELVVLQPAKLDASTLRREVETQGLAIAAIASGAQASLGKLTLLSLDLAIRLQAFDRLLELIRFAAEVNAPLVTIGSFRGRVPLDAREQAYEDLVAILRLAASQAASVGVRLVIEPVNRYETELIFNVGDGLALIEAVGHSHLGLLFDTFHMNIEEPSLEGGIRKAMQAGRLWHVHIADSNRLAPGQGHIPFPEVFATLRALGYDGFCSAELLNRPSADTAAARTIEYCRAYQAFR